MSPRRLAIAALLATMTGCSDYAKMAGNDMGGSELDDTGLDASTTVLRLDVFPSDATADLLPQSITLDGAQTWDGLTVQVRPSVEITGRVTGFVATPTFAGPSVPGQDDVPIAARIDVSRTASVAGGSASTDEDGEFLLRVPAGEDYDLVIVPEESALLPFEVRRVLLLGADLDLPDLYLDYGAPVWGQVTRSNGQAVTTATVHLVDADTGSSGPIAAVDEEGWFLLRAYPGDYELVVQGDAADADPTVRVELSVEDEDGARIDVDLGPATRREVQGVLVDGTGERLGRLHDYVVRLTAVALDDIDGELVYETESDAEGRFFADVMVGEYLLEVIPEYDAGMSPLARPVTVGGGDLDLGQLVVPDRVPWSVQILDPRGDPAADVLVVAREIGFDGYTYSASTGSDGLMTLDLPATEVELTMTPSTGSAAITHLTYDPAEGREELSLVTGQPVTGTLVSGGEPVSYALLEVRDQDGRLYATGLSNADGAFSFRVESEPALLP